MSAGTLRLRAPVVALVPFAAAVVFLPGLLFAGTLMSAGGPASAPTTVPDVPPRYLALYRDAAARYRLGADGWSYLAGVGKVECDHGRSQLPGCHSGSNYAGAQGPAQFLASTWAMYGVDGDGDGRRDVYDPVDAIPGMARYLRASGAPADWRRALFAYNHDTAYVNRVLQIAASYRAAAARSAPEAGDVVEGEGRWLAPIPGFPGERCDARIVPDVVGLSRAFGITVSDCYGGAPHKTHGEHPLGLAIDASPVDGDWRRTELLARRFGWRESCAVAGCPGAGPFRVILYNGFPEHGDPRHARFPHIHLSWQHGPAAPFSRAPWVRLIFGASAATWRGRRSPRARRQTTTAQVCAKGGRSLLPDPLTTLVAVRDVKLNPRPKGLPGSNVLQGLVDGLAFWGLLAALAALVVGAAVWAWASHAQNHHHAAGGRRAAGVAALAALLIGAAPALINFFADAGDHVK